MRKSAGWMTIADERILEYLSEHESGTPKKIADTEYIRFSRSYIHQRCEVLREYGLIQHLGNGVHIITAEGEQYLAGELDAAELETGEK